MGSLHASGVPVVAKNSNSFRKRDVRITRESSRNDTIAVVVSAPVTRTITSGSIVRDNGTVVYYEDLVWGAYLMGRSNMARVASKDGVARSIIVDLDGANLSREVIPTGLGNKIPQVSIRHLGNTLVEENSVRDNIIVRHPDSGVFDPGWSV